MVLVFVWLKENLLNHSADIHSQVLLIHSQNSFHFNTFLYPCHLYRGTYITWLYVSYVRNDVCEYILSYDYFVGKGDGKTNAKTIFSASCQLGSSSTLQNTETFQEYPPTEFLYVGKQPVYWLSYSLVQLSCQIVLTGK